MTVKFEFPSPYGVIYLITIRCGKCGHKLGKSFRPLTGLSISSLIKVMTKGERLSFPSPYGVIYLITNDNDE